MLKRTVTTKVLRISIEVNEKFVGIASGGGNGLREVAKIYVCLEAIQCKIRSTHPEFWNVGYSASGILQSFATLKNGTPIWRLYPNHRYCIALLAELDGDIHVLDVCNKAEIGSVELSWVEGKKV
ncbi:MAG: hypothetical protein WBF43_08955 [Methylocella sp.]